MPSWDSFDQMGTDSALGFMARNPTAPPTPKPSAWGQVGEFLASPFKGALQAAGQTARNVNRVAPLQVGNPLAMSASDQEDLLHDGGVTREGQDKALRSSIDAFKPDPLTSTGVSLFLQDAGRLLTKVAGYSIMGGPVGAVMGTGIDEGLTGFTEMRDQGVDPATAAKVGAVRGVATAAGVALPVVGKTGVQTAALILGGGPASFMAEQAITHQILESANYPELAAEHDPFDPVGLGVSTLVPGVFGVALHRARVRKAAAEAAGKAPPTELPAGLADTPEIRDAAHVAYRDQQLDAAMLGDRTDPRARADHADAMQAARQALDDGAPMHVDTEMQLDPAHLQRMADDMQTRLQRVDDEIRTARAADELPAPEPGAVLRDVAPAADTLDGLAAAAMRVLDDPTAVDLSKLPAEVNNLVVGLRENGGQVADLLDQVREIRGTQRGQGDLRNWIADAVEQTRASPKAQISPELRKGLQVARQYPDMPVRLDDGAPAQRAADVMESVSHERRRAKVEARAFDAAVECFLEFGQ